MPQWAEMKLHPPGAILTCAREHLMRTLKRYDVADRHIELQRLNTPPGESVTDDIVLGLSFIGPGLGADAPYGQTERAIDMRRFRHDASGLLALIYKHVESMCEELFGVHEGEGLP